MVEKDFTAHSIVFLCWYVIPDSIDQSVGRSVGRFSAAADRKVKKAGSLFGAEDGIIKTKKGEIC